MAIDNADAGDEGAIMKPSVTPEIPLDGNVAEDGHALDEVTLIDAVSIAEPAPAPIMSSPSSLPGLRPESSNPPPRSVVIHRIARNRSAMRRRYKRPNWVHAGTKQPFSSADERGAKPFS